MAGQRPFLDRRFATPSGLPSSLEAKLLCDSMARRASDAAFSSSHSMTVVNARSTGLLGWKGR
jgi:hypothetical protein